MPDYEDLILERQEEIELWEDDPSTWEVYYGRDNKTTGEGDPELSPQNEPKNRTSCGTARLRSGQSA